MRYPVWALIAAALCASVSVASAMASSPAKHALAGDPVAGRRLYFDGVSATGKPITAKTQGDIEISGAQFSCVSCHRPSAYGSSEGGIYVPPIRGDFLFKALRGDRNRIFHQLYEEGQTKEFWAKMRNPRVRPAYTMKTFGAALTDGKDPTGRVFDPTMPRYKLSEADVRNLAAYLETLKITPDPGVTDKVINFATIISPGVDPAAEKAMLDTEKAFVSWMNVGTKGDLARPGFSPNYRSNFASTFRLWRLHVWRLEGPPETWPDQLEKYYKEQPVFAIVGGIVKGSFAPIADFCDKTSTPCVFPNTELPRTEHARGAHTLYFSRGRELEGEALATFLIKGARKPRRIHQYFLQDDLGEASARAFERKAKTYDAKLVSEGFPTIEKLNKAVAACCRKKLDAVVIWPGADVKEIAPALSKMKYKKAAVIGLPSDVISVSASGGLKRKLKERLRFSYPYEKPGVLHPREFYVRAWFGSRRVTITNPRVQFDAYFAMTMIEHILDHMLGDFNRDYLIELIEHEAEKNLNIGVYPTLALGPGQRFASKGAYIMRLDAKTKAGIAPDSDWIVP